MLIKFFKDSLFMAVFALFIAVSTNVAAGEYEGSWIFDDSQGDPFEANLHRDGIASGTHGTGTKQGTWKEENGAAVIHWNTGWTTRIEKKDGKYAKEAFKPGTSLTDAPTNTSEAKRK